MRKNKYIFPAFSFYDRTGIQNFLEQKAMEGWMLERLGGFFWKFRAIEPKKIHFTVTFFPKASMFDALASDQQIMYQEYCAHSGWNLVASSAQLQIFCSEEEDPIPIETDPEIELENIHNTAKKTYLPTYLSLLLVGILPWFTLKLSWESDPIAFLSTNIYLFNLLTSFSALLMGGTEVFGYFRWYAKAKKAAPEGEFVPTKGRRKFQLVLVWLMIAGLAVFLLHYADTKISLMMIAMLVLFAVSSAISVGATKLMKKMKVSARKNMIITYALIAVLSIGFVGFGTFGVIAGLNRWNPEEKDLPTYEFRGSTHVLYRDELLITVQDFMEVDPDVYSYRVTNSSESLLVKMEEGYQRPRYDRLDQPDLRYTIAEVKTDFLFDFCLEAILEANKDVWSEDIYGNITYDEFRKIDASPWGADAAYQEYSGEHPLSTYLLCYGSKIIEFDPDWDMREDQMAVLGEMLG